MNDKFKKIIRKKNKSKIVCLTAYSKNIASILDNHCDIILVGDSLGSVFTIIIPLERLLLIL